MSSGIVLLIVVAVILVIVAYLVGILIRKRNDSRIAQLEERKQKLFDLPINEEIEEVKNLHLIGQSPNLLHLLTLEIQFLSKIMEQNYN